MRLLVLGGTSFVGRHIVAAALARDQQATIFNRGQTNPDLFPSVERRRGDRSVSDLAALERGEWDAVIDVSALLPRMVREAAGMLAGRVGLYACVSVVSTYRHLDVAHIDEDAPLKVVDDPTSEVVDLTTYGGEAELREAFPSDHLIIRAGTMAGAEDNTDRFTYWVRRLARGTPVLAPSRADQPVQLMHARDHADFLVGLTTSSTTGVFNAVGPDEPATFADMLQACADAAGTAPRVVWAPQAFLDESATGAGRMVLLGRPVRLVAPTEPIAPPRRRRCREGRRCHRPGARSGGVSHRLRRLAPLPGLLADRLGAYRQSMSKAGIPPATLRTTGPTPPGAAITWGHPHSKQRHRVRGSPPGSRCDDSRCHFLRTGA